MVKSDGRTEITGVFVREKNVFGGVNGKPRTIVGSLANGTKIKGDARENELVPGLTYVFSGVWFTHETWGKQFNFKSFAEMKPTDENGIIAYLEQARGIGSRYASEIYRKFGQDSIKKIKEAPEEVAAIFPRLPVTLFQEASRLFISREGSEKAKLELIALLNGFSIPRSLIETLIDKIGVGAANAIKNNPYLLCKFKGVGFKRADILYQKLGKDPAAIVRQVECVVNAIETDREGHTWVEYDSLRKSLADAISSDKERLDDVIKACDGTNKDYVKLETATDPTSGKVYVTLSKLANQEEWLANDIAMRCVSPCNEWPDPAKVSKISDHQREQLAIAMRPSSRIAVISGGPGTGKTYLASRVAAEIVKKIGLGEVCAVAPTGKAAVRLSGVLSSHGVDIRAKTIHSTLGIGASDDGDFGFAFDQENPIPKKVVIIDEPSMITTQLLYSLFCAIHPDAMILIVGDPYQLSPVGKGAPFRDMVANDSPIPHGHLTEIQRNSGLIAKVCAMVRDEGRYDAPSKFDLENGGNLVHLECPSVDRQVDTLIQCLNTLKSQDRDVVWEVQVITALNNKTIVSRKPLNVKLQALLNAGGKVVEMSVFRDGDKVINLENSWLKALHATAEGTNPNGELYVANGEQGEVFDSSASRFNVSLFAPEREVQVFKGKGSSGDSDEESATDTGCKWDLGYAISGHKSQGSEWPITFIMVDDSMGAKLVCSREWVYTVLSRARTQCVTIGKKHVIDGFCRTTNIWKRKTFLREQIEVAYRREVEAAIDEEINEHGGSDEEVGKESFDSKDSLPIRDTAL